MPVRRDKSPKRRPRVTRSWSKWSDEQLLDLRFRDLPVKISGSWLEEPIALLYEELEARGIQFHPHFWLSNEWFSPDGIPGVAIPFYLAHPRLMRLEKKQMFEVEGSQKSECMRLLRHESGHAVQQAFRLHKLEGFKRLFGRSSQAYPEYYLPNPASKRFVHNIKFWYAQSHPDEDFAETFAVWLAPRSPWRKRYAGWPALKKLEWVDQTMRSLVGKKPVVRSRQCPDQLSTLSQTLRDHYQKKRRRFEPGEQVAYDRDLKRIFTEENGTLRGEPAAAFLRRHKKDFRGAVARWTEEYAYTLDVILHEMIQRSTQLKLRAVGSERALKLDVAVLLSVRTLQYVFRGREWHPL